MRAVKSVAVQVWIALILLLLSLFLPSSLLLLHRFMCVCMHCLFSARSYTLCIIVYLRLHVRLEVFVCMSVWCVCCACVCWCMACFWLCFCCVFGMGEHVPALYSHSHTDNHSFSIAISFTYTQTHCGRNMLGHKIRWLRLVSVDLLTSAGTKIASNIPPE